MANSGLWRGVVTALYPIGVGKVPKRLAPIRPMRLPSVSAQSMIDRFRLPLAHAHKVGSTNKTPAGVAPISAFCSNGACRHSHTLGRQFAATAPR